MIPLEVIGHIVVPAGVMLHRFAREAYACARLAAEKIKARESLESVIGTANTKKVELYGWAPNVDSHADKTGIVYLVALNSGKTTVNVLQGDDAISVELPRGTVVRLDDHATHWTEDNRVRVCAFIGSYDEPHDAEAITLLQAGVAALARGDYYGAPRVRDGFRVLMDDECLVLNSDGDGVDTVLHADALTMNEFIVSCAACEAPAVRLDSHFPYQWDMNRCREHLKKEA
jgi:hypothetical protein